MREVRLDTDRRTLWRAQRIAKALRKEWRRTRPPWRGWGEPFNGQIRRTRTVAELIGRFEPDTLIETGTYFGFTSRYLASYGLPVYTVELDPGIRLFAKRTLRGRPNVTLVHGDSATALGWIASASGIRRPLLYLDAHSPRGLPLEAELNTVLDRWPDFVLLIDDFKVPGDPDYLFWTFECEALAIETLRLADDVLAAFPAAPASSETGARRGTVYLGRGDGADAIEALIARDLLVAS